jgi:acyl-CoA synthetase (AMP-forming)/AMP-acid ligase II
VNIADEIARHARIGPARVALIEPMTDRTMTFAELDARADRLAGALAARCAPGDRVAIIAQNCIEYMELYVACARAGCVAHGMNWRLAPGALAEHLRDSAPRMVLVQERYADLATELQREIDTEWVLLGGPYEEMLAAAAPLPAPRAHDDDPFAIMYTGGTTGDSKGALHSHSTMLAAMANNTIAERVAPATDRYMLLGQAFHSAAVLALNYLRHGCGVIVLAFEPKLALDTIDEHGATAFLGFPAMLTYMLEAGADRSRYHLKSLRNIQYGGGLFPQTVVRSMLETFPCTLIQCYGTTESVGITFLSQEDHARALAGRPDLLRSCGTPAYLNQVRLSPTGEHDEGGRSIGELEVRSPANMLGYWRDFAGGARPARPDWLPTGDLATMDAEGYLTIVGRSKDVIRSGGENIYAGQIENVIYGHPAVLEAAVVGMPDEVFGEAVKAVVVLRPGQTADAEEIVELVRAELGSYQKPKVVEFVDALPRTPTGKIMKRDL